MSEHMVKVFKINSSECVVIRSRIIMSVVGRRSQMIKDQGKVSPLFLSSSGMIRFVLVIMFISLFSCVLHAEIDDNLKGVPPSDISEWNYYGFSAEESQQWIKEGIIFAGWAAQWRDEGFTAAAAGRWRKIANVYTAGDFLQNGFSAEEAEKWMANGIRSGLRAREYFSVGLTAEEAAEYWSNGIYPEEIKEWRNAGFDVQAMMAWHYGPRESTFFFTKESPYGRNLYELEAAIQWRDAGFTAQEMQASGKYRFKLEDAKQWKTAGFSFFEAVRWRDFGFTVNDAVRYKNAGLSPVAAELQRYDSDLDKPDEITTLDLEITLNKDGSLEVVETAAIIDRPGGFYENGYYKSLPKQARLLSSRSGGYSTKQYSGTVFNIRSVEINGKKGDFFIADNVLHFGSKDKPLTEGEHLIKIVYSTDSRVLFEPHHDELCFDVIEKNPKGRYIRNATATVRLPPGAHVIFTGGNGGFDGRNNYACSVEETETGDIVHFALTTPVKAGMSFSINIGFIKGYVVESRIQKLIKLDRETGRMITSLVIFLTAFILLFLYYFIVWFSVGRDPGSKSPAINEFSPPDNMDPAMLRTIHTRGKVDYPGVAAELIYLAESGLIEISGSSESCRIIKTDDDSVKLSPIAKHFYANLWAGIQTEISLTRKNKCEVLSVSARSLKTILKNEHHRHSVSNIRYLWPGIIFAVAAIAFSLAVVDYREYDFGKAKIFVPIYTGFLITAYGILIFVFKRLLRSVTEDYAKLRARVQSYVDYLTLSFADIGAMGFVPSYLQKHFPYAIAAGLDVDNVMIRKGDVKWYHGTGKGLKLGDLKKMVKKSL